jgi:hypothetical protein
LTSVSRSRLKESTKTVFRETLIMAVMLTPTRLITRALSKSATSARLKKLMTKGLLIQSKPERLNSHLEAMASMRLISNLRILRALFLPVRLSLIE